MDATCAEAIQTKFTSPKLFTVMHSQHMHAQAAEATCFSSFSLYNTHTRKKMHTHIGHTHTHISSATVATAAAVGCHHWSCLHTFDPFGWELYCWRRKNSKTELMCVFVLHGRGEPFFSPSTNRKTLAAFSQDRGRQWQRERSQSDIDLNQTNPPLVPM